MFSTDASGSAAGGQTWKTLAGCGDDLYVKQGDESASFVNSGNGSETSINIPLSVGMHTFTLHGEYSAVSVQHMGLNLFFGGDNNTPRISVFGADNIQGGAATGGDTFPLNPGSTVPGANSLTFIDATGRYRVTLSSFLYRFNTTPDTVSFFNNVPSGTNDNIITFTLTVVDLNETPQTVSIQLPAAFSETNPVNAYRMIGIPVVPADPNTYNTLKTFWNV